MPGFNPHREQIFFAPLYMSKLLYMFKLEIDFTFTMKSYMNFHLALFLKKFPRFESSSHWTFKSKHITLLTKVAQNFVLYKIDYAIKKFIFVSMVLYRVYKKPEFGQFFCCFFDPKIFFKNDPIRANFMRGIDCAHF